MSIIRGRLVGDGFSLVPHHWLRDPELSYKGKGLLSAIASHREDYELTVEQLIAESKDGKDSVNSGVKELERVGYLVRSGRRRKADGTLGGYDYQVIEFPHADAADDPSTAGPRRKTRTGHHQGKRDVSAGRNQRGFTTVENPRTKKTTYKKTKKKTKEPSTPGPSGPVQVRHARERDDAARANPEHDSNKTDPTPAALAVVAQLPRHWREGAPSWVLQRLTERIDRELTAGGGVRGNALGADAIVAGVAKFGTPAAVGAALGDQADNGRHLDALTAVLRTVRSEVNGGTWCRLCGPADHCQCPDRPARRLTAVAAAPDAEPLVLGKKGHCDLCGKNDRTAVVDESQPLRMAVCATCCEAQAAS